MRTQQRTFDIKKHIFLDKKERSEMMNENPSFIPPQAKPIKGFEFTNEAMDCLPKLGIDIDNLISTHHSVVSNNNHAMDSLQAPITTPSTGTPIQFLQNWLPGFVWNATSIRQIDDFIGIMIIGAFEDAEIVQAQLEMGGSAVPYGDYTNTVFDGWNTNFEKATVVRFEMDMQVGNLEAATASRMKLDVASTKRTTCILQLDIIRNAVGFYGYNNGANNTYGFLNAPGLPAYVTVAVGASTFTEWSTKTMNEIFTDVLTAAVTLQTQTKGLVDPRRDATTLAVSTAAYGYLAQIPQFGVSVIDVINKTYPKMRVTQAPQLDGANGGANVFYLYADEIMENGTDGGKVFIQVVPTRLKSLGVEPHVKNYEEGYANATAGVMCKRPYAVVRFSGI